MGDNLDFYCDLVLNICVSVSIKYFCYFIKYKLLFKIYILKIIV